MWQVIAQFHPALAMRFEDPLAAAQRGGRRLDECKPRLVQDFLWQFLPVAFGEHRLGVKQVEMRWRARHKNVDARFRLRIKMWLAWRHWIGKFLPEQAILQQQRR